MNFFHETSTSKHEKIAGKKSCARAGSNLTLIIRLGKLVLAIAADMMAAVR